MSMSKGKFRTAQLDDVLNIISSHMAMVGPIVENWTQLPLLNTDIDATNEAATTAQLLLIAKHNRNWELSGTNAVGGTAVTFADGGGIKMLTAGADNDQVILSPHANATHSALAAWKFNTNDRPFLGTRIETGPSVAGLLIEFGFVLTNALDEATDADQVKIRFDTDDSDTTFTINTSIDGDDVEVNSTVTVEANTAYDLTLALDADRYPIVFINGTQVFKGTTALTADIDLKPVIGMQALEAAAKTLYNRKLVIGKLDQNN